MQLPSRFVRSVNTPSLHRRLYRTYGGLLRGLLTAPPPCCRVRDDGCCHFCARRGPHLVTDTVRGFEERSHYVQAVGSLLLLDLSVKGSFS